VPKVRVGGVVFPVPTENQTRVTIVHKHVDITQIRAARGGIKKIIKVDIDSVRVHSVGDRQLVIYITKIVDRERSVVVRVHLVGEIIQASRRIRDDLSIEVELQRKRPIFDNGGCYQNRGARKVQ
jgi:hypothetical protein